MKLRDRNIYQPRFHMPDDDNKDRWVISYADFITLLLSFFIAMYAISSVNVGKYKQVAQSIQVAFNKKHTIDSLPTQPTVQIEQGRQDNVRPANDILNLATILKHDLNDLIDHNLIEIKHNEEWIEISLKSKVLFPSADAVLLDEASAVLEPIALILKQFPNPIRIEGFTDSLPISNPLFPSNWELSAARSSAVARFLIEENVPHKRLFVVGFADNYPISDNSTLIGREQNRRVNIVISKSESLTRLQQAAFAPPDDPSADTAKKDEIVDQSVYQQQLKALWEKNKEDIKKLNKLKINGTVRFSNHPERIEKE